MFYFLFQYLTLSARSHYAEELVRAGWLDESAVVSDAQLEMMYGDMMTEALEGSSPEFAPAWSTDGDSQRTISLDEEEVGASGGERWTDLTPSSSSAIHQHRHPPLLPPNLEGVAP